MKIHAISTGSVQITPNWFSAKGARFMRLANTLFDPNRTAWLPVYCYVIEHPEGLIVVDTGSRRDANAPVYFPPWIRLLQRVAKFRITPEQEIGPQMRALGLPPEDVRWVVLTHLHQDHDGGLGAFPAAEFVVSRAEWAAARGLNGRLAGYLNQYWQRGFSPTLVDFENAGAGAFPHQTRLTAAGDICLAPLPGHSAGQMGVLVEESDHTVMFAGDSQYSQDLLLAGAIDGVGPDPAAQRETHRRILQFAAQRPTVYLPSHEWDAARRLEAREALPFSKLMSHFGSEGDYIV